MSEKEHMEWLMKRNKRLELGALVTVLAGLMVLIVCFVQLGSVMRIVDNDHLSDPDIFARDLDNATYTWSAEELAESVSDTGVFLVLGAASLLVGQIMMALVINQRKMHAVYCKEGMEPAYCAHCGVKLSRLKP